MINDGGKVKEMEISGGVWVKIWSVRFSSFMDLLRETRTDWKGGMNVLWFVIVWSV